MITVAAASVIHASIVRAVMVAQPSDTERASFPTACAMIDLWRAPYSSVRLAMAHRRLMLLAEAGLRVLLPDDSV